MQNSISMFDEFKKEFLKSCPKAGPIVFQKSYFGEIRTDKIWLCFSSKLALMREIITAIAQKINKEAADTEDHEDALKKIVDMGFQPLYIRFCSEEVYEMLKLQEKNEIAP